ncbi:MAG: diaminopimelate epimerase [Candidatus Limimorpha sp.]
MPILRFFKYQGAGNDFVMLNFFDNDVELDVDAVRLLCCRQFGIGADGLISISESDKYDFRMRYYNSDGHEASFCGNGSRCAMAFANDMQIIGKKAVFEAFDGIHEGDILSDNGRCKTVSMTMQDVEIKNHDGFPHLINTGSPHYIIEVADPDAIDVKTEGARIRYDKSISLDGVNVNFIHWDGRVLRLRTYERGVEDETLACGTGITASAIATAMQHNLNHIEVIAKGGQLQVDLQRNGHRFHHIRLIGPAQKSFSGEIEI